METLIVKAPEGERGKMLKAALKAWGISFEKAKKEDKPYNPEFVKKILESIQQAKEGKTVKIDLDDIWK